MNFGAVDTSGRSRKGRGIASRCSPALKTNVWRGRRFPQAGTCPPSARTPRLSVPLNGHTRAVLRINKTGGIHRQFRRA